MIRHPYSTSAEILALYLAKGLHDAIGNAFQRRTSPDFERHSFKALINELKIFKCCQVEELMPEIFPFFAKEKVGLFLHEVGRCTIPVIIKPEQG